MSTSVLSRRQLLLPTSKPTPSAAPPPAAPAPSAAPTTQPTSPPTAAPSSAPTGAPTTPGPDGLGDVSVPSVADRHLLSRFSWGITSELVDKAAALGGGRAWFDRQLEPDTIPDGAADDLLGWWPCLQWSPAAKFAADLDGVYPFFSQDRDFARWTLMRRITTNRQLNEVMVDLWGNLLYITIARKASPHFPMYDATLRKHALGTYEALLKAAVLHPAMLCYLDNAKSTMRAPNENLGRELLELHTVGRLSEYSERDVKHSTRILTGHRVMRDGSCVGYYSPEDHFVGKVKVLGFEHPNPLQDGRDVTDAYLSYLAHHDSTARLVARALAVRFVSDAPSDELIEAVARAYLDSGTDIPTTLRALVDHDEFAASAGQKVRTPVEDFVNTYRVMQATVLPPDGGTEGAATSILLSCASMGQQPFEWPRPDGFPDIGEAWSSACRMLGSWQLHKKTSAAKLPHEGIVYQPELFWLGPLPVRFDALVDRLCRLFLAKPATPRLVAAAARATATQADDEITATHRIVRALAPTLFLALLDTPDHMTR